MNNTPNYTFNVDYYWQPACGGTETPFTKNGKSYIYLYNGVTRQHAYYCITDDLLLDQKQVDALFFNLD